MNKPFWHVAAGSAYLAPPLLLVSDILLIQFISEPGLLVQRIALIVLIPAIVAVAVVAHDRARWQRGGAAAVAILGALAIVIRQGFLAAPIRLPAVLFPLGLLALSGAMMGTTVSRRIAALIAAGALLFPVAHMSGAPVALLGGDVLLLVAFWSLATRMTRAGSPIAVQPGASRG
ncbi:MAG TPA: hypothetical protein VFU28_27115 [Vicinamibacterales bacterium]|nr:hypothetical protein [Vicinamibacterales bacterium]